LRGFSNTNTTSQLIELWETFLFQLDSDEDGPPFLPAGVHADQPSSQAQSQHGDTTTSEDDTGARKNITASDDGDGENGDGVSAAASVDDSQEDSRTLEP
jgi:sorting nexin-1/2